MTRTPTLEDLHIAAAVEVLLEHVTGERPIANRDFAIRTLRAAARALRGYPETHPKPGA